MGTNTLLTVCVTKLVKPSAGKIKLLLTNSIPVCSEFVTNNNIISANPANDLTTNKTEQN